MSRNQSITWDHDKRLSLHILRSEFELSLKETHDIFLSLFQDIVATDIRGPLRSQDSERKAGRRQWEAFHSLILSPAEQARRDDIKRLINEKIARLGAGASRTRDPPNTGRGILRNDTGDVRMRSAAVPLSRQPPIASYLMTPEPSYMDAGSSSRKRNRPVVEDDEYSDDEIAVAPASRRRVDHPQVQIKILRRPVSSALVTPPQTPRKSVSKRGPTGATLTHQQTSGLVVRISPKNLAKISEDLIPISDEEAHPPRSRTGLFFRHWDADLDSEEDVTTSGFVARRYKGRVKIYQEPPPHLDWTDVFYHIDPKGKEIGFDSPVISMTDKLWWIFRLALKEMNRGVQNGRIAVIDAAALNPRAVFHVLPHHRQLKKKYEFTAGAWHYAGTHEYLCFKEIPPHAILSTFRVRDLFTFVNASPSISRTLRLETLAGPGGFLRSILPAFQRDNVQLTPQVIAGIAELANFMGLDAYARGEHLAHIWTDVIQGWGLQVSFRGAGEWVQLAARFARASGDCGGYVLASRDSRVVERAFLEGVHWAYGRSLHTRAWNEGPSRGGDGNPRARVIGVGDPGGMVDGEGLPPTRAVRRSLQAYRHQPLENFGSAAGRTDMGESSRVGAAGRRMRDAIGVQVAAEDVGPEDEDEYDEDEIQYD